MLPIGISQSSSVRVLQVVFLQLFLLPFLSAQEWAFEFGASGPIADIVYDGEKFAAINASGKVLTSPTGRNWTRLESGPSLIGTVGRAVAVGDQYFANWTSGYWSSTDLINWTPVEGPIEGTQSTNVAFDFAHGRYIGLSLSGNIYHSVNRVDWVAAQLPSGFVARDLELGENFSVALSSIEEGGILTSTDGITWTPRRVTNPQGGALNEMFIPRIAARNGSEIVVLTRDFVARSADGVTWTARSIQTAAGQAVYEDFVIANGIYIAVSSTGSEIYTSTDEGLNWVTTPLEEMGSVDTVTALASGGGTFLAGGSRGGVYRSADGLNWEQVVRAGPFSKSEFRQKLSYQEGRFRSLQVRSILDSEFGLDWDVDQEFGNDYLFLNKLLFADDQWVLVGSRGNIASGGEIENLELRRSRDNGDEDYFFDDLAYGNGRWVAATRSNVFVTSSDGITWTDLIPNSDLDFRRVTYGNGIFIAYREGREEFLRSVDGLSWSDETTADFTFPDPDESFDDLSELKFLNGQFLNVNRRELHTSTDGSAWVLAYQFSDIIRDIAYDPVTEFYMAVGSAEGGYFTSKDLSGPWVRQEIPFVEEFSEVAAGGGYFTLLSISQRTFTVAPAIEPELTINLLTPSRAQLSWKVSQLQSGNITENHDLGNVWELSTLENVSHVGERMTGEVEITSSNRKTFYRFEEN